MKTILSTHSLEVVHCGSLCGKMNAYNSSIIDHSSIDNERKFNPNKKSPAYEIYVLQSPYLDRVDLLRLLNQDHRTRIDAP